jgi:hypothetical protein
MTKFEDILSEITETSIEPKGWYPVVVEHGIKALGNSQAYEMQWRVKGTEHTFRIPLNVFYEQSKSNYEEHFTEVLEIFRIDYLGWYKQGFKEDWMQKYRKQFKELIYTFE